MGGAMHVLFADRQPRLRVRLGITVTAREPNCGRRSRADGGGAGGADLIWTIGGWVFVLGEVQGESAPGKGETTDQEAVGAKAAAWSTTGLDEWAQIKVKLFL